MIVALILFEVKMKNLTTNFVLGQRWPDMVKCNRYNLTAVRSS